MPQGNAGWLPTGIWRRDPARSTYKVLFLKSILKLGALGGFLYAVYEFRAAFGRGGRQVEGKGCSKPVVSTSIGDEFHVLLSEHARKSCFYPLGLPMKWEERKSIVLGACLILNCMFA